MVAPAKGENMGTTRDAIIAGYMKGFRFATDGHKCPPNVGSSFAAGYVNGSRAWVAATEAAEACADLVLDSPAMAQARANAESGAVVEFDEPTDEQRRTRTLTGRCTIPIAERVHEALQARQGFGIVDAVKHAACVKCLLDEDRISCKVDYETCTVHVRVDDLTEHEATHLKAELREVLSVGVACEVSS